MKPNRTKQQINLNWTIRSSLMIGVFLQAFLHTPAILAQTLPSLDQCLGSEPPAITTYRPRMKLYSGHYVHIGQRPALDSFNSVLAEIKMTKVTGIMKRYTWSDLEPTKDNWQLSALKNDLDLAQANGKKVFPLIQFKYKNMANEPSVPGYVRSYEGGIHFYNLPSGQGTVPNFGRSFSQNRFLRLLKEIAMRFDGHPGLAGISFNETSSGINFGTDSAARYAYSMGLIRVDKGAACLFRRTPVIQMTNTPAAYLEKMGAAYKSHAIGIGTPHVYMPLPTDWSPGTLLELFGRLNGFVPKASLVTDSSYRCLGFDEGTNQCIPSSETYDRSVIRLFDQARNLLNSNFIFWNRAGGNDPYYQSMLKFLNTTLSSPLDITCPSNYVGGCSN